MGNVTMAELTARAVGDDEPLGIRVGHDTVKVVVDFGATVRWVGLSPAEVRVLAEHMLKHAADIEAGR
jgi:hypothetical protein